MRPICESCGEVIEREIRWSQAYYATRRFCDRACEHAHRPAIASDYTVDSAGCWIWQGHIDKNGYGRAYDPTLPKGRRTGWAHRVSYQFHRGEIPAGYELDHTCEVTACINPDHLDPVTRDEHVARTIKRAGHTIGQDQAVALRQMGLSYGEIANALHLGSRTAAHSRVKRAIESGRVSAEEVPRTQRLDAGDTDDIQTLYALGVPQGELADWYKVHPAHISRLVNSRNGSPADRRRLRRTT